ncbi:MAG: T9SS type A sorting domain-containing protein [candidate division Zixibacteria bacterium]|nr:T9SS type A sorting domain-containing protein [candidate division Zixibacteria bacterium]
MRTFLKVMLTCLLVVGLSIAASALTIYDVQYTATQGEGCYDSPEAGNVVELTGIVTAAYAYDPDRFFIQDMGECNLWSGVYCYSGDQPVSMGDSVTVVGEVQEYNGLTEIFEPTVTIHSSGYGYNACCVETGIFSGGCGFEPEQYEGMLVRLCNVTITDTAGYGDYYGDDGSGQCLVIDDVIDDLYLTVGETYASITGVVYYAFDEYRIAPRYSDDIKLDPLDDLIINEIHYNPPSFQGSDYTYEWIELYNPNCSAVDLEGYEFTDGVFYTFPSGAVIEACDYMLVSIEPDSAINWYGLNPDKVYGPWSNNLTNAGEPVRLADAMGNEIDYVHYNNEATDPWPRGDDNGGGSSLELMNWTWYTNDYGPYWAASVPNTDVGTPLAANSTFNWDEPGDDDPPCVEASYCLNPGLVRVLFSEAMDETSVEIPGNYSFTGGIGVYDAQQSLDDPAIVDVTCEPTDDFVVYTLTVANVMDTAGNVISDTCNTAEFRGGYTPIWRVQEPVSFAGPFGSKIEGEWVTIHGVVTCEPESLTTSKGYYYVEDTSFTFAYGVKAYKGTESVVHKGEYVTVAGQVLEYNGETEVQVEYEAVEGDGLWQIDPSAVYPAIEIDASNCTYNDSLSSEPYECLYVRIYNMELVSKSFGSFGNNFLFTSPAGDSVEMQLYPHADDSVYYDIGDVCTVTGYLKYYYDHYILCYDGNLASITKQVTDYSIAMEPINPPIEITPPGTINYNGHLVNSLGSNQSVDVWLTVVEGGNSYPVSGGVNNLPLPPYAHFSIFDVPLSVPGFAPAGDYTLIAFVGDKPNVKVDSSYFGFTVLGMGRGEGGEWASNWLEGEVGENLPTDFALSQNYPNPFNPTTTFEYELPADSDVKFEIYNIAGQRVATLIDGEVHAGYHTITWDGSHYSSGIYFYKLTAGDKVFTKRMTLLK